MVSIPQFKKKINSFLTKEEGKISKENLIKTGILLGSAAIAALKSAEAGCPLSGAASHSEHCNQAAVSFFSRTATGAHSHSHGSHSSHSSHSSHCSHNHSW